MVAGLACAATDRPWGMRMRQAIDTGLPALDQPFEWAIRSGRQVFTAHGPLGSDGKICAQAIDIQAQLTLDNLCQALAAAGASLADVAQVTVYLTDMADMLAVDRVYRRYFDSPYPSRCCVGVKALAVSGMRIEIQATAVLGSAID